jgi:hypothetical protein
MSQGNARVGLSANLFDTMETVIPTAHCLCWTDAFVEAVARDAICGIIAALNGYRPEHVVNPAAKAVVGQFE